MEYVPESKISINSKKDGPLVFKIKYCTSRNEDGEIEIKILRIFKD